MATLPILNHPNPEVRRLATLASDLMSRRLAVGLSFTDFLVKFNG